MQTSHPSPAGRRPSPIHRAIVLPPPPAKRLTPAEVGAVMKRARKLGRRRELTPYDHRVLDALLFQCASPLSGSVVVSYGALARITGMARSTIAKAIARLAGLGLLQRIKRRLRVAWHQGGTASLQAPNAYAFNVPSRAHTESAPQAVIQTLEISYCSQQLSEDAQKARQRLMEVADRRRRQSEATHREKVARALREGRFVAC